MLEHLKFQVAELPEECDIIDFRLQKDQEDKPQGVVLVRNDTLDFMEGLDPECDYDVTENDARYTHKYTHEIQYKNLKLVAYSNVLPRIKQFYLNDSISNLE